MRDDGMSRRYAGTDDMEGGAACYVLFFVFAFPFVWLSSARYH